MKMRTVALIGPDGAGKTTLTKLLLQSGVARFKYLYMGVDVPRGHLASPATRLAARWKDPSSLTVGLRGIARGYARLIHRLTDEWFRQLVSWTYQARGYTVLYDRHFALDFAPEIIAGGPQPLHKRIHAWSLRWLYPLPDLIIFLDAPGETLYARKGELNVIELERRRQGFLRLGSRLRGFVRVDATRPLLEVYGEVSELVKAR